MNIPANENVPHDEWLSMLRRSADLYTQTRLDPFVWRELRPLNQRIRRLALLPTTKDSWPTRLINKDEPR